MKSATKSGSVPLTSCRPSLPGAPGAGLWVASWKPATPMLHQGPEVPSGGDRAGLLSEAPKCSLPRLTVPS